MVSSKKRYHPVAPLVLCVAFATFRPASAQVEVLAEVPSQHIHSVSFSADGRLLAGGSWDRTVRIWDARSGEVIRTLQGHKGYVRAVAFAPSGSLLASGSDDRTVILWNAKTGEPERALEGFAGDVYALSFSADGETLAVASDDVTLWNPQTGKLTAVFELEARAVSSMHLSPDGKLLAAVRLIETGRPGEVYSRAGVYDVARRELSLALGGEREGIYRVAISSDGRKVAGAGTSRESGPSVRLWDLGTGDLKTTFPAQSNVIWAVAFSPDGRLLASGGEGPVISLPNVRRLVSELRVWNRHTGREELKVQGDLGRLTSLCFSPDGKHLAYCDLASVAVIDVSTGERVWSGLYR